MRSIERTLLLWIVGALTLGALVLALVIYLSTLDEMNEVFDANLKVVAEAVGTYHASSIAGRNGHGAVEAPVPLDVSHEYQIVTLTWTRTGQRVYASDPSVKLTFTDVEGMSRPKVDGEQWIVYTSVRDEGVAQAAQRVSSRETMAGESADDFLPPMLVLVVVAGVLLVFGLRRGFGPLDAAARDVAARSAGSLDPMPTNDVPREIAPLVVSINGLMERLSDAFATQRRFLADAAHELRTPVTALRLQLQLLQRSPDEASRASALAELESGIARAQHLIEQLLQVARSEPDGEKTRMAPVDLGELARSVVGSMSIKAEHRGIDLGAAAPPGVVVAGDFEQLTVLLNNLVGNALRYTPAGGMVDVTASLESGSAVLRVIDGGPGISPAERERVFDRFYRGEAAGV